MPLVTEIWEVSEMTVDNNDIKRTSLCTLTKNGNFWMQNFNQDENFKFNNDSSPNIVSKQLWNLIPMWADRMLLHLCHHRQATFSPP